MAESKDLMARLNRLEGAFVQITDLLVLQGERLDHQRDQSQGVREETRTLRDEMRALREQVTHRLDAVTDRLDRLIAITTRERTAGIERLANIEARLARLEQHAGI